MKRIHAETSTLKRFMICLLIAWPLVAINAIASEVPDWEDDEVASKVVTEKSMVSVVQVSKGESHEVGSIAKVCMRAVYLEANAYIEALRALLLQRLPALGAD